MSQVPPIPLFSQEKTEPVAFLCGTCKATGGVFSTAHSHSEALELATNHCRTPTCRTCGETLEKRYYTECDACMVQARETKLEATWQSAKKVTLEEYAHDFLSAPDVHDELFPDLDALIDHCEQAGIDLPTRIFGCYRQDLRIDASDVIDNALEQHHEDAADNVSDDDRTRLQTLLNEWVSSLSSIVTYWEDRRLGIIPPDDVRERHAKGLSSHKSGEGVTS